MIWREKRVLLVVLALLLVANAVFFFTYRVQYEARLSDLDARLDQAKAEYQEARRARTTAEQQIAAYRKAEREVQSVYRTRWSTQNARLTPLISEVKRLTVASNLVPQSISFSQTEQGAASPTRARGLGDVTEVGISFSIQGPYQRIRQLINRLELSEQFVIIDQISLAGADGENLTLNLHLKTLFGNGPAAPAAGNQDL